MDKDFNVYNIVNSIRAGKKITMKQINMLIEHIFPIVKSYCLDSTTCLINRKTKTKNVKKSGKPYNYCVYESKTFLTIYLGPYINDNNFQICYIRDQIEDFVKKPNEISFKNDYTEILYDKIIPLDFGFGKENDNNIKKFLTECEGIKKNKLLLAFLILIAMYPPDPEIFPPLMQYLESYCPNYFRKPEPVKSVPAVQDECADNFDINTDDLNRKLVGIANILCEMGKQTGRLIPIKEAEQEEPIELPTLDYDSSVMDLKNTRTVKLYELIAHMSENLENYSIIGSGGCGKTYSLLNCAGSILANYNSNKSDITVIPIYIPLNYLLSKSKNIEDYIIRFLADSLEKNYNEAAICFLKWKTERNPSTYILLLLDGFNEVVSAERQASIVNNVKELQNSGSLYRFIITSRYDLSQTFANVSGTPVNSTFVPYKMNDLEEDTVISHVENFLSSKGKSPEAIKNIINNELLDKKGNVRKMYRQPMALVMFCGIHTNRDFKSYDGIDFYKKINNLGELIHDFIYCIRNAYDFDKTKDYDAFLSYLGYRMNTDGVFTITLAIFNQYLNDFSKDNPYIELNADLILNNSFVRDILKYNNSDFIEIRFAHQNYRDYFAAYYLKKIILAGDIDKINTKIGIDKKIPEEVVKMLADIIGEYKHNEKIGIQHILNECGEKLNASATAFLVKVAVTGRENQLWDFQFKSLNLSLTHLNGVFLYKKKCG